MRHVPRTHWVDLDWLWERSREDRDAYIKYVGTKVEVSTSLLMVHLLPSIGQWWASGAKLGMYHTFGNPEERFRERRQTRGRQKQSKC